MLNRFSPLGVYETRHLLNGFVGIIGLAGCWRLGRALSGPRAGLIALVFLLLTPNYYGQMFNNPKDIPFAVGGVWATYYMVRILPALPRPPLQLSLKMGLAIGLALGVRVGGLLFVCYLGFLLLLSGGLAGGAGAAAVGRDRGGMDEPLARAAAGRRDRVCNHAGVLAVGAARPDRQPAACPRLLLARDLPIQHLVRWSVCPGQR